MWNLSSAELLADVARVYLPPGGAAGKGSLGSGRLITPSLVLTARHVLETKNGVPLPDDGWQIRLVADKHQSSKTHRPDPYAATVVWRGSGELDLALIRLLKTPRQRPRHLVLGELTGVHEEDVKVAGFPDALWNADGSPEDYCFSAKLSVSSVGALHYHLRAPLGAAPLEAQGWGGLSGAAVLAWRNQTLCLLGAVRSVQRRLGSNALHVTRIAAAMDDDRFRLEVEAAFGTSPITVLELRSPSPEVPAEAVAAVVAGLLQTVTPEHLSRLLRDIAPQNRQISPNHQGKIAAQVIERLTHPERTSARVKGFVEAAIGLLIKVFKDTDQELEFSRLLEQEEKCTPDSILKNLVTATEYSTSKEQVARLHFLQVQFHFLSFNYRSAYRAAQRAVAEFPGDRELLRVLGLACMRLGRFEDAARNYESRLRICRDDPSCGPIEHAEALIDMAAAFDQSGGLTHSEECLQEALLLLQGDNSLSALECQSMAYNNLGGTLLSADRLDEAHQQLSTAVRLRKSHRESSYNIVISLVSLAECTRRRENPRGALQLLEEAEDVLNSDYNTIPSSSGYPPHILLGMIYSAIGSLRTIDLGDPVSAVKYLEAALDVYARNGLDRMHYVVVIATNNVAVAYLGSGDCQAAVRYAKLAAAAARAAFPTAHPIRKDVEEEARSILERCAEC